MKDEYNFTGAVRGKFYNKTADYVIPVYLEPELQALLLDRATLSGATLDDVANELIRKALTVTPAANSSRPSSPLTRRHLERVRIDDCQAKGRPNG